MNPLTDFFGLIGKLFGFGGASKGQAPIPQPAQAQPLLGATSPEELAQIQQGYQTQTQEAGAAKAAPSAMETLLGIKPGATWAQNLVGDEKAGVTGAMDSPALNWGRRAARAYMLPPQTYMPAEMQIEHGEKMQKSSLQEMLTATQQRLAGNEEMQKQKDAEHMNRLLEALGTKESEGTANRTTREKIAGEGNATKRDITGQNITSREKIAGRNADIKQASLEEIKKKNAWLQQHGANMEQLEWAKMGIQASSKEAGSVRQLYASLERAWTASMDEKQRGLIEKELAQMDAANPWLKKERDLGVTKFKAPNLTPSVDASQYSVKEVSP